MSAFPEPHPKLRTLDPMVGRWHLQGRTDGAAEDNIAGTIELDWLPGGHFLRQHTLIDFQGRWAPDPGRENDPGMVAYEFAGSRLD